MLHVGREQEFSGCNDVHMSDLGGNDQTVIPNQRFPRRTNPFLAIGCQRYIRGTCVTTIERPFCLTVTDDEGSWGGHYWGWGEGSDEGEAGIGKNRRGEAPNKIKFGRKLETPNWLIQRMQMSVIIR